MKPGAIEEIRAKWAEWGSLLGSAIEQDKCVEVPARHCEGEVMAFLVGAPRDVEALFKALAIERAVSAFWRARSQYLLDSDACALAQTSGAPPEHVEIMRDAAKRAFEREVAASKRCADLGVNPWIEAETEDRADEVAPDPFAAAVAALAQEAEGAAGAFDRDIQRHYNNPNSMGAENARSWARDLRAKVDAVLALAPGLNVEKDR